MKHFATTIAMLLLATTMNAQSAMKPMTATPAKAEAPAGNELMKMKQGCVSQLHLLTDDTVERKIRENWTQQRGLLAIGFSALVSSAQSQFATSAKSLASEAMTKVLNSTIKRNDHRREQWLEIVNKQNRWSDSICTATEAKDFYSDISHNGALDPEGMQFDGFRFEQNRNGELAYRIRCCIDVSEEGLREITQHGKFRLVVDSLYINPYLCNLPTATSDYPFEFEDGAESVNYTMKFTITSSWLNQAIEYFKDQRIGEFSLNFILDQKKLNATDSQGRGVYEYVAGVSDPKNRPQIFGESLIVPRSYLGCIETDGQVSDVWSTGQFNIALAVSETRRINASKYWMNKKDPTHYWKNDYKRRVHSTEPSLIKWVLQEFDAIGRPIITTAITAAGNAMVAEIVGGSPASTSKGSQNNNSGTKEQPQQGNKKKP